MRVFVVIMRGKCSNQAWKMIEREEKRRNNIYVVLDNFSSLISSFQFVISCFLVRNEREFYSLLISKSSQDWRIFLFERRVRFVVQWKISFVKKSHFKYNLYCSKKNVRDRFNLDLFLMAFFLKLPSKIFFLLVVSWNKGKAIRLIMTALYASLKD